MNLNKVAFVAVMVVVDMSVSAVLVELIAKNLTEKDTKLDRVLQYIGVNVIAAGLGTALTANLENGLARFLKV